MPETLWTAVGEEIRAIRERAGWRSTNALALAAGQRPTQKTMDAIERGKIGAVSSLVDYCAALRISVRDVLAAAVARSPIPSPRAMSVARAFDALPATGQRAIWSLVEALEEPPARPTEPGAGEPARPRTRRGNGSDGERTRKRKTTA